MFKYGEISRSRYCSICVHLFSRSDEIVVFTSVRYMFIVFRVQVLWCSLLVTIVHYVLDCLLREGEIWRQALGAEVADEPTAGRRGCSERGAEVADESSAGRRGCWRAKLGAPRLLRARGTEVADEPSAWHRCMRGGKWADSRTEECSSYLFRARECPSAGRWSP